MGDAEGMLRVLAGMALVLATALACLGCGGDASPSTSEPEAEAVGAGAPLRLTARPRRVSGRCRPGEYDLRIGPGRRALMRVTPSASTAPRALLLALHGAGSGGAPGGLYAFRGAWDVRGLVIVAPAAAGSAWTLGARDVRFVDLALQRALSRCRVDPRRVGIGGFSSGAGMALWLGLSNGDLFSAVIALSGGGALPTSRVGKPRIFIAHGTRDAVIPIEVGGDRVARDLRAAGYVVTYDRFAGGHRVKPQLARRAVVLALRS